MEAQLAQWQGFRMLELACLLEFVRADDTKPSHRTRCRWCGSKDCHRFIWEYRLQTYGDHTRKMQPSQSWVAGGLERNHVPPQDWDVSRREVPERNQWVTSEMKQPLNMSQEKKVNMDDLPRPPISVTESSSTVPFSYFLPPLRPRKSDRAAGEYR